MPRTASAARTRARRTPWLIPLNAPHRPEDLSFIRRDATGRLCWWAPTPPSTHYSQPHRRLGEAYAWEWLDLVLNPGTEVGGETLGFIACAIAGEDIGTCRGALLYALFATLGRYLTGQEVYR